MSSVLLVASRLDPASMNIRSAIQDLINFEHAGEMLGYEVLYAKEVNAFLMTIDKPLIKSDFLDALPNDLDRLLFLSRHVAKSGMPALLIHTPGNWTEDNSMGGKPKTLCWADPALHRSLLNELIKYYESGLVPKEYLVGIEVTHHGPTINRSCTFIEIGSSEKEWQDSRAAKIIAEVIISALKELDRMDRSNIDVFVGFGGPHYAPKFFARLRENNSLAASHIAPKYVIDALDIETVKQAFIKSRVKPTKALIDWKGLRSPQRKKIIGFLESLGISFEKI